MVSGMIVIGNGEPCPFCGKKIYPFTATATFDHIDKDHKKEQMEKLFPNDRRTD